MAGNTDPIWHVSSRSGVATLRTAIHLLLTYLITYLLTYLLTPDRTWRQAVAHLVVHGTSGSTGYYLLLLAGPTAANAPNAASAAVDRWHRQTDRQTVSRTDSQTDGRHTVTQTRRIDR